MTAIRLFLDEDASDRDLARGLRLRQIDVLTAVEVGPIATPDTEVLAFATREGRVLFSFNNSDYFRIHSDWLATERNHAGIILSFQRFGIGGQIDRFARLFARLSQEDMVNRLEFLSSWG